VVASVPEPVLERVRLALAQRIEARLRRSPAVRGAAIVFHSVAPRGGDYELEVDPPVESRRLDIVVGYLARRYLLVRAGELPSAAGKRKPGERLPIAVTFDDDLASHREHAAPIFRRHDAVATAFLCGARSPFWWQLLQGAVDTRAITADALPHLGADLVEPALERRPGAIGRLAKAIEELAPVQRDRVAAVLREAVPAGAPVLGAEDAASLVTAGWEIGFHTRRHDLLTALNDRDLREALERGRDELTGERPGSPARTLAYPHGKATERESRAAREAGYVAGYTGRTEVLTDQTDVHLIGRLQPDTTTIGRFALGLARALSTP
jgi:peptidoglycan/xylan/chitin deacetylase (PgdA/CDA1 family)